jgi:hypothetical protein
MTSADSSVGGAPFTAGHLIVYRWLMRAGSAAIRALTVQYLPADNWIERATAAVSASLLRSRDLHGLRGRCVFR